MDSMDEASNGLSNDSDVVLIPNKPMTLTKKQLQQEQDQQLLSGGSSGLINPDSQSSDDKKKKNTRVRL